MAVTPNEPLAEGYVWVGTSSGIKGASFGSDIKPTATVSVTNAELKALRATPKTIVAAPGANKVVVIEKVVIKNSGGANAITESDDNLALKFTNGSGATITGNLECTGFIDQTAATYLIGQVDDLIVAGTGSVNQAVVLHNTGDGEFGGNAAADVTLTVYVWHKVLSVA